MQKTIAIVDRGRGPQLSTSRITVQDLVPYFQDACSHDEIIRWIPTLTVEEIQAIERYIQEHYAEVMDQDRRIRERAEARRKPARSGGSRTQGATGTPRTGAPENS